MSFTFYINGEAIAGTEFADVKNPATGEVIGQCPIAGKSELDAAVSAAKKAFPLWSQTSDDERKDACNAIVAAIGEHAGELATLLTKEQGKPLSGLGSNFEIGGCQAWAGNVANTDLPVKVLQDNEAGRIEMHRKPIGVVGSITPWNFPLMIAVWHVVPAIRTGNTVVIKPSPYTSLSSLKFIEVIANVLPKGVLNIISGGNELGQMMTEHPDIQKIVFTGSCGTGKKIMASASSTLKRLTLELGGNDAGIILPDVDAAKIAENLFWGIFINNGQTCAALKRLYVHEGVYDAVVEQLVGLAQAMPMGNGLDENNVLGPLQNEMQFNIVKELVEDALANGAKALTGGKPADGPGYFYPATILVNVKDDMRVVKEEQFGPVIPVLKFTDVEDVIARANDTENGLGGSVWSADKEKAMEIASRLECGSVWINQHGMIKPGIPFGGVKASGIGVEFGEEGLKEYTTVQSVFANNVPV